MENKSDNFNKNMCDFCTKLSSVNCEKIFKDSMKECRRNYSNLDNKCVNDAYETLNICIKITADADRHMKKHCSK